MFEFGRGLKRILGVAGARQEADCGLLELFDAAMLASQGKAWDVAAGRVSAKDPFSGHLAASAVWREHARRSGDVTTLRKAAAAARSASQAAATPGESARAALEQGLTSLVGVDLYGDPELLDGARDSLKIAAEASSGAVFDARLEAAWARVASREALATDSYPRALEAAALFDSAIHHLDEQSAHLPQLRLEAAHARIERADLMAGFGVRNCCVRMLESARIDLAGLLDILDAGYEPLTWARAAEGLGSVMVSLGELEGRPEQVAEGVSILGQIEERFPREHSPLDWIRSRHALAIGLQALGDAADSDDAFVQAERAFEEASNAIGPLPLAIRPTIANNRAACLARHAERRGDLDALTRAEAAFKTELAAASPTRDPIAWAVLQVNLARIYESRGQLMGRFPQREAAVYALEGALDVFRDHGLKTMAEAAVAGLERVRQAAA